MGNLKIHGKLPSAFSTRPLITKIKTFLDKLPNDEIYAGKDLQRAAKLSAWSTTKEIIDHPALKGYSHKIEMVRYWGNPKAISELMRQTQRENR